MNKRIWAIGALVVALGGVVTGVSSAGGAEYKLREISSSGGGVVAKAAADQRSCYTQFAPTVADGGDMAHYYRNCNGVEVRVAPGWVENGQVELGAECATFTDGQSKIWFWETTPPAGSGVEISTFFC